MEITNILPSSVELEIGFQRLEYDHNYQDGNTLVNWIGLNWYYLPTQNPRSVHLGLSTGHSASFLHSAITINDILTTQWNR